MDPWYEVVQPRIALVIVEPDKPWTEGGELRPKLAEWTRRRGKSPLLYPASPIWRARKPGRELREGASEVKGAADKAREEVWASYRFIMFADPSPRTA